MNSKRRKELPGEAILEGFILAIAKVPCALWGILWEGLKGVRRQCPFTLCVLVCAYSLAFFGLGWWRRGVWEGMLFVAFYWLAGLISCGIVPYCRKDKAARALARLKIRAGDDCRPILQDYKRKGKHKTVLSLISEGVGIGHYRQRASDIEAIFNAKIEGIRPGKGPKFVEITLSTKTIPSLCRYQEMKRKIARPYSFVVGEGLNETVVQSILDFPGGIC